MSEENQIYTDKLPAIYFSKRTYACGQHRIVENEFAGGDQEKFERFVMQVSFEKRFNAGGNSPPLVARKQKWVNIPAEDIEEAFRMLPGLLSTASEELEKEIMTEMQRSKILVPGASMTQAALDKQMARNNGKGRF